MDKVVSTAETESSDSAWRLRRNGASESPRRPKTYMERRNSPRARAWKIARRMWLPSLLIGIAAWATVNATVLAVLFQIFGLAINLAFAIVFAIIQFVAIFWFMAQTKVETIRPGDPKSITFADYWGQPTLVRLVKQWITLLSDRDKFVKMGGKYINGILLAGEPGTGKTLLAKAMAGEAGIAFISIEGSGFRAMFWGVDVLRMIWFVGKARKLAKEYGACIAFIDEIDAVGMSRGGVMGGQGGQGAVNPMFGGGGGTGALTRLLYEMDGIGEMGRIEKLKGKILGLFGRKLPARDWHVLFLGSTNRPDVLDPALTRPGRFDRTIMVDKPDRSGRREILKGYLSKIKHDPAIDIEALVSDTAWATPAKMAAAITKDAVRLALFDGRDFVAQRDIELAFQEQAMGLENPIEEMEPAQQRQVAYHEAGHVVAQYYLDPDSRIVRATIIRRSGALGYVLPVPNFDIYAMPLKRIVADILVSMAGHVASKLFLGEHWTGASSDFQQARARITALADLGYFGVHPMRVDQLDQKIVDRFWADAEEQVERLLAIHSDEVHAVAQALLERGDLSSAEVYALLKPRQQTSVVSGNGHQPGKNAIPGGGAQGPAVKAGEDGLETVKTPAAPGSSGEGASQ